MIYRIIRQTEAGFETIEMEAASVPIAIARASIEGFDCTGLNKYTQQRADLWGQPKFEGLLGPMWDGDAIRYECPRTYEKMSA